MIVDVMPLLAGSTLTAGAWLVVVGALRRPPALGQVLQRGGDPTVPVADPSGTTGDSALGRALLRLGVRPGQRSEALLAATGRSRSDFLGEKVLLAGVGVLCPSVVLAVAATLGLVRFSALPGVLVLLGAVIGWFAPDLALRRARRQVVAGAQEAVFTYIDLVGLERLANRSSSQALASAAKVSDAPLFRALQVALERAQMQQRPAWQALHEVAESLHTPALADIADVMRLDEQGAALSPALRSRLKELRDGYLMGTKIQAQKVSESMTLWMVIPALVFGLILLLPPIARLVLGQ